MSVPFCSPCSKPRISRFDPENERKYPIKQMGGWALCSVWTGVEKRKSLTYTGVLTAKRPFRSESITRKEESFYTVGYTHRPITLSVWYHDNNWVWEISFVLNCSLYFILGI